MNDVPFHLTVMGRRFYEAQLPAMVAALERIGDNLERIGPGVAGAVGANPQQSPRDAEADRLRDAVRTAIAALNAAVGGAT